MCLKHPASPSLILAHQKHQFCSLAATHQGAGPWGAQQEDILASSMCVGRWWMKPQSAKRLLEQNTDSEE